MSKPEFIDELKQKVMGVPVETLRTAVLKLAEYVPKGDFDMALSLFDKTYISPVVVGARTLISSIEALRERIENGNFHFTWRYAEDYYDDYWDEDEILEDEDGLGEELARLITHAKSPAPVDFSMLKAKIAQFLV